MFTRTLSLQFPMPLLALVTLPSCQTAAREEGTSMRAQEVRVLRLATPGYCLAKSASQSIAASTSRLPRLGVARYTIRRQGEAREFQVLGRLGREAWPRP